MLVNTSTNLIRVYQIRIFNYRIVLMFAGIETLPDYRFKYGKNPLLELPLAVNPSGCARLEPRARGNTYKRAFTQRTSSIMPRPVFTSSPLFSGDISCPYSKHFVHSKSSQYKKMKQEWRNYVYLARYVCKRILIPLEIYAPFSRS